MGGFEGWHRSVVDFTYLLESGVNVSGHFFFFWNSQLSMESVGVHTGFNLRMRFPMFTILAALAAWCSTASASVGLTVASQSSSLRVLLALLFASLQGSSRDFAKAGHFLMPRVLKFARAPTSPCSGPRVTPP